MAGNSLMLWIAVAALALVDLAGCYVLRLTFTDWLPTIAAVSALGGIAIFYHVSGRSARLAGAANWVALWIVFSVCGIILSYIAAARGAPWQDAEFAALDAAMGLDWVAWAKFVADRPVLERLLSLAYISLMPQILLSVAYFALRGREEVNYRFFVNAFVALLLTVGIFSMMPAIGPWMYYLQAPEAYDFYLRDLQGLHDRTIRSFAVPELKGIICVPSFHTVLAILLVEAHRRSRLLLPVAALNGLMLMSIPNAGGHYFVDVLAGAAVAGAAILVTGALRRRSPAVAAAAV